MKVQWQKVIVWTPRVLSILFALFLSLFALDVFGAGYGFWQTVLALLIHLIPVFVLLIALALAWRWPWVGAAIYIAFGVWYVVQAWGSFPLITYVMIAGPALLSGLLFLMSWLYGRGNTPKLSM